VLHAAALRLLRTPTPEARPIYPWTAVASIVRLFWNHAESSSGRPSASGLAAKTLLGASATRRSQLRWTVDNLVLTTWVSRHLTAEEALSAALESWAFGAETRGVRDAAERYAGKRVDQLSPEEVARLVVLASEPSLRAHPDKWRLRRDGLLNELHAHRFIDDATLLDATARAVPDSSSRPNRGY
jgi:membrane peptidoglycan carboxypeptidase